MPLSKPLIFDLHHTKSTALLILNASGKIEDFNDGFRQLLGYSKESLVGRPISQLYLDEDIMADLPGKLIKEVLSMGSSEDNNFMKHRDGSKVWIHSECIFAKDNHGNEYIVKIIQDLNGAKILEEKLLEINKEQERIIKDHETFVYTTSHDLVSPINNLDALVQNVEESYNDPETIKFLAPLLKDSIARLRSTINELSFIGKKNERENKNSYVFFESVFNEVLIDLYKEIEMSKAEIASDFSLVPVIKSSKKYIRSILQNLISNSLKFRSPKRPPVISVTTEYFEDLVLLQVRDNGLGIDDHNKEKIFDMYHRLHTHIEGTGVGLGIVERIVKNVGGKIELESEVGTGSLFKIYLKDEKEV